jgi:hypothetical protein
MYAVLQIAPPEAEFGLALEAVDRGVDFFGRDAGGGRPRPQGSCGPGTGPTQGHGRRHAKQGDRRGRLCIACPIRAATRNVTVEYHWMEGRYDRLPALMADLVRRRVALIAASIAAKAETASIPIVFGATQNPVTLAEQSRQ